MTRIPTLSSRIVTAIALVTLAIAAGQWLSKPPVTAAPPPKYEKQTPTPTPAPPKPATRPVINLDDLPGRAEVEVTISAEVVAPSLKEDEPTATDAGCPCNCQPTYYRRGLFRWR